MKETKLKSNRAAAERIVAELKKNGIKSSYYLWGSCPIIAVPELGFKFVRPWAMEPYYPSWDTDEFIFGGDAGLTGEEMAAYLIKRVKEKLNVADSD